MSFEELKAVCIVLGFVFFILYIISTKQDNIKILPPYKKVR